VLNGLQHPHSTLLFKNSNFKRMHDTQLHYTHTFNSCSLLLYTLNLVHK
jgi:hypothetical protein